MKRSLSLLAVGFALSFGFAPQLTRAQDDGGSDAGSDGGSDAGSGPIDTAGDSGTNYFNQSSQDGYQAGDPQATDLTNLNTYDPNAFSPSVSSDPNAFSPTGSSDPNSYAPGGSSDPNAFSPSAASLYQPGDASYNPPPPMDMSTPNVFQPQGSVPMMQDPPAPSIADSLASPFVSAFTGVQSGLTSFGSWVGGLFH